MSKHGTVRWEGKKEGARVSFSSNQYPAFPRKAHYLNHPSGIPSFPLYSAFLQSFHPLHTQPHPNPNKISTCFTPLPSFLGCIPKGTVECVHNGLQIWGHCKNQQLVLEVMGGEQMSPPGVIIYSSWCILESVRCVVTRRYIHCHTVPGPQVSTQEWTRTKKSLHPPKA